jgi:phosphomannomutase
MQVSEKTFKEFVEKINIEKFFIEDFPEANLLRVWLGEVGGRGVRLQIRPSGTEPKVKLYGEAVDMDESELQKLLAALAPN